MNIFQQYISSGLSVIPCKGKIPILPSWKKYQLELPKETDAAGWNDNNIAIICGVVSGGLICIDFDVKNGNRWDDWLAIVQDQYPELLSKLVIETTPSGGYHVVFRSNFSIGNKKLASKDGKNATIETRGEGGYFVCYPSENYQMYYGNFESIQKLTDEEAKLLIQACKSLNEYVQDTPPPTIARAATTNELTPFDDYNNKCNISELLNQHGWKTLFNRRNTTYYCRPGKEGRGISASWNAVPDRFYVFTTSTQFENQHIYKPSAVYSILEHGGNFINAAKELRRQGYGEKKEQSLAKLKPVEKISLLNVSDMGKKIIEIRDNGFKKGKSTGWKSLDNLYSVIKGQFTVITGYPSHGKSEFVDSLTLNLAMVDKWKFAVLSPENYPAEIHFYKLIEKVERKGIHYCSNEEINQAINFISKHFFFIDALEEDITLDLVLTKTEELIKEHDLDGLVIDPWNEIELSRGKDKNDSDYIGDCLRTVRKFARKNNIHLWIVAHPTKMQKIKISKKGEPDKFEYPIPELYDIQGSSHWRNKADNGICVYRDMESNLTEIIVQKIKFRFTGKPGMATLKYDINNGCYYDPFEPNNDGGF